GHIAPQLARACRRYPPQACAGGGELLEKVLSGEQACLPPKQQHFLSPPRVGPMSPCVHGSARLLNLSWSLEVSCTARTPSPLSSRCWLPPASMGPHHRRPGSPRPSCRTSPR